MHPSLYRQVDVTTNKVCTDANSILIYCPDIWYEEKIAGTNIIGGNYWGTSYSGIDADNDGLGYTPFSPFSILTPDPSKDLYPLVYELTVNRTGDQPDADLNDGRCDVDLTTSGNQCTFRAAIEEANKRFGRQIIAFAISSTGIPVITPLSPLPPIIDDVELRASTQTGGWVELNGSQAGIAASGLVITAAQSSIKNMIIRNFSEDGINAAQYIDLTNTKVMANGGFGVRAFQDISVHQHQCA